VFYPSHPEAYTQNIVSENALNSLGKFNNLPHTPNPIADKVMNENGLLVPIVNQQVLDYIQQESCNLKTICNEFEVFYDDIKLINENSQIQLSNSKSGDIIVVNLENYIHNEIMDYCYK
jgi:hypothetical protein